MKRNPSPYDELEDITSQPAGPPDTDVEATEPDGSDEGVVQRNADAEATEPDGSDEGVVQRNAEKVLDAYDARFQQDRSRDRRSVAQRIRDRKRERQQTISRNDTFYRDRTTGEATEQSKIDEAELDLITYAELEDVARAKAVVGDQSDSNTSNDGGRLASNSGKQPHLGSQPWGTGESSNAETVMASINPNHTAGHNSTVPGQSART